MHEVDYLPGREALGEQPSPLPSLGHAFVRQGDVAPMRSDLAVPYPVDPHGGQQSDSPYLYSVSIRAKARAGALSTPENL